MDYPTRRRTLLTRRRFLQGSVAAGMVATAGCSSDDPTEAPVAEPIPWATARPTRSPIDTRNPTVRPAEESCATTEAELPSSDGAWWPMFRQNHLNTGRNSRTYGPEGPVGTAWQFETKGSVRSSPAVVDETVFVGSDDGHVYAVDAVTGDHRWQFETGGPITSSPAVFDGTVFVGSMDQHVYAIDSWNGHREWQFQTEGPVRCSPTVGKDSWGTTYDPLESPMVYVGSDDGRVYALDAISGEEAGSVSTGAPVVASPFAQLRFYYVEPYLVGVNVEGTLYLLELRGDRFFHLEELLKFGIPTKTAAVTSGQGSRGEWDNSYFFGTDSHQLHVYGKHGFEFETAGKVRSAPALDLSGQRVYFGSWDGHVYAVGFSGYRDQVEAWTFKTGGKVESSPAVADGVVYVGSADQHVYALDSMSGDRLWDFRTGGAVYSSPAVVNGTVFVGSNDGHVYALTSCH